MDEDHGAPLQGGNAADRLPKKHESLKKKA
jgi:hypothetical protein